MVLQELSEEFANASNDQVDVTSTVVVKSNNFGESSTNPQQTLRLCWSVYSPLCSFLLIFEGATRDEDTSKLSLYFNKIKDLFGAQNHQTLLRLSTGKKVAETLQMILRFGSSHCGISGGKAAYSA